MNDENRTDPPPVADSANPADPADAPPEGATIADGLGEAHRRLADLADASADLLAGLQGEPPAGASLTVVGTGIRALAQLTVETLAVLRTAEVLLHVVGEPVQEAALKAINPAAETMTDLYGEGLDRGVTYEAMVQKVLAAVGEGRRTVAAFYGHPGVYTYPSHESVRRARAAGFPARMLPGISAADCMYADLGIDPGDGSQSYEATDFLYGPHPLDPAAHLFLWQVGTIGNWTYESGGYDTSHFPALIRKLLYSYPPAHPVGIYEATFEPAGLHRVLRVPLGRLRPELTTPATTLHLPPLPRRR